MEHARRGVEQQVQQQEERKGSAIQQTMENNMKHKLTDETKIYMKKFTFKTEQPTGRYRSFYAPYHIIKCNKKGVGSIESNSLQNEFKIQLRVMKKDIMEDNNPNCKWKTIRFKKVFSSLQEAKDWLNNEETLKAFHSKFTLAVDED